ncbi:CoB--CoM heterodisulfide reductase iron-sulfur subunit B family protein [Trichlorobacter lovleyi]|uniref:CoB--CoM heterodisulfide reductase iron-sulfur subunit B family protein n=1 Tax=Trichlorobacter lovleyi TaxID=313985 RepID=UPI00223FCA6B|nr:CoB--CoM heterodisulfide reductase iron-sulfur subunit B family protein [Trichlorobacter lovleyi]QOX78034.1 CoB--CoM heterodisulfide reductase iron-sulfur subunit B family protein [Trichlorobacter lovleyi]
MSGLRYSYYPGCSLHASASEYDLSTREVFAALGIGLDEVPDWICCGATPAHNVDELLSLSLCAKNLELAEQVPGDMAVACAACFSRLKFAQHVLKENEQKLRQVEQAIDAKVPLEQSVKHLLEILVQDLGTERLSQAVKKPLSGLKVACYYGCLLTRPPEVPQLDDCEAPTIMERLLQAVGAETVDWTHRMECCGANFTLSRPGVVLQLTNAVLDSAKAAGADCIMVGCPLCHGNLDIRQKEIEGVYYRSYDMPIFYLTQLVGLALGVPADRLGMDALIVSPQRLLREKKLL